LETATDFGGQPDPEYWTSSITTCFQSMPLGTLASGSGTGEATARAAQRLRTTAESLMMNVLSEGIGFERFYLGT